MGKNQPISEAQTERLKPTTQPKTKTQTKTHARNTNIARNSRQNTNTNAEIHTKTQTQSQKWVSDRGLGLGAYYIGDELRKKRWYGGRENKT